MNQKKTINFRKIKDTFFVTKVLGYGALFGIIASMLGLTLNVSDMFMIDLINVQGQPIDIKKLCDERKAVWENRGLDTAVKQLENLLKERCKRYEQLKKLKARIDGLEAIYYDPNHPDFHKVNFNEIKILKEKYSSLQRNKDVLKSIGFAGVLFAVVLSVGWAMAILFGIYLMIKHASFVDKKKYRKTIQQHKTRATSVFLISAAMVFGFFIIRVILTNFFITETYIGCSSLCISELGWLSWIIVYLGGSAVSAYAFTVAFILSGKDFEPEIVLQAPDLKCGVGKYILFLKTWFILGCLFVLFPVLFWLYNILTRDQWGNNKIYMLDLIGFVILVVIIVYRLLRRAFSMKYKYYEKLESLEVTHQQFIKQNVPPDPTTDFLGVRWWSLPASLGAILTAIWILIKYLKLDALFFG